MKSEYSPKQKKQSSLAKLLRDIFTGGKGYRTVKGEKTPFPTAVVVCSFAATILFLALVFAFIKVSNISAEIAGMKKELITLSSEKDTLQGELDRKYSFEEIENTARDLGLSKNNGQTVILDEEKTSSAEENTP